MDSPQSLHPDSMIGQLLDGRYELTQFMAEGGMGAIYKARQHALDRDVVVKLLLAKVRALDEFQQRFFLEASLCARLSHPNIVRIFDYGCHGAATYFIVMEHLKGMTLKQCLRQSVHLQPKRAVGMVIQICSALVEAHDAGMIHRDIKPDNLFVTSDVMSRDVVKILDFGVVKQLAGSVDLTQVDKAIGTPLYMSPEQITGSNVDYRSDLYALGCVFFQLLTGVAPFAAADIKKVLFGHLSMPPPTLAQARRSIKPNAALQDFVDKALQKDPESRFENARAMLSELLALEQALEPTLEPERAADEIALSDATTRVAGLGDTLVSESILIDSTQAPKDQAVKAPSTATSQILEGAQLEGYVGFIDFNCPYCFALHERLCRWGVVSQIEWSMIEDAPHLIAEGEEAVEEDKLSDEVFEVRHRAPDIDVTLPLTRARGTPATRLIARVQLEAPDRVDALRRGIYQALWQRGEDIGDATVLCALLREHGLGENLLEQSSAKDFTSGAWQNDWENGGFDNCIPVLIHRASNRQLIGLPAERALAEFLVGKHQLVVDQLVCFYQRKPTILVCGWMRHLWAVLRDVTEVCEILQASSFERATELLNQQAVPDLVLIETGHLLDEETAELGKLARSRKAPWAMVAKVPSPEAEIAALSAGAVEYLPLTGGLDLARMRLERVLKDRHTLVAEARYARVDALTKLPTRQALLEKLERELLRSEDASESLSLVVLNIDEFKHFNQTCGYLTGDSCLVQVANCLRKAVRHPGHSLVRFGGNEFAVLLPDVTAPEAQRIGSQLRVAVAEHELGEGSGETGGFLTMSMGVHTISTYTETSKYDLIDGAIADLLVAQEAQN